MRAILRELVELEIENVFVIGASRSVNFILSEVSSLKCKFVAFHLEKMSYTSQTYFNDNVCFIQ